MTTSHTATGADQPPASEPRADLRWATGISHVRPNQIAVRGYDINALMGRVPFAHALYLLWVGELPSPAVGRLIDAILVCSMDHGPTPPSVLTARTVASTGAPLGSAIAAGVLALSKFHGAAVEDCMRMIQAVVARVAAGEARSDAARAALADLAVRGERASGLGHRLHTTDPRTAHLFELARDVPVAGEHIAALEAIQGALAADKGRTLPINVDGAIAAVLCEIDFPVTLANALFIIARVGGITAQAHEEQRRMKPMRRISPADVVYDGPADRPLPA